MATPRYQRAHETHIVVDAPAEVRAWAFENIGSIILDGKPYPIPSSNKGRTYTVYFSTDEQTPLCFPDEALMEMFRREDVEVVFAGYWYDNKLIYRFEEDGSDRRQWINFGKAIVRTEKLLEKIFNRADEVIQASEPVYVEVPVPMIDWADRFRWAISSGVFMYVLAVVSLLIVR